MHTVSLVDIFFPQCPSQGSSDWLVVVVEWFTFWIKSEHFMDFYLLQNKYFAVCVTVGCLHCCPCWFSKHISVILCSDLFWKIPGMSVIWTVVVPASLWSAAGRLVYLSIILNALYGDWQRVTDYMEQFIWYLVLYRADDVKKSGVIAKNAKT